MSDLDNSHPSNALSSSPDANRAARTVLVLGDSVEAWIAAVWLARQFNQSKDVAVSILARSETDNLDPFAIASGPELARLNRDMGLKEDEIIRACNGTFCLGTHYLDWAPLADGPTNDFSQVHGDVGAPLGPSGFHHALLQAGRGLTSNVWAGHSPVASLALAGRFAPPDPLPGTIGASYDYGLHLEVAAYRATLKRVAAEVGVVILPSVFADAGRDADGVRVSHVRDAVGNAHVADLYLDADGLIHGPGAWRDMEGSALFDRVQWSLGPASENLSLSQAVRVPHGLAFDYPLQTITVSALYFAAATTRDSEIYADIAALGFQKLGDARPVQLGVKPAPWAGNVIAIGGGATRLLPFDGAAFRLLDMSLRTLVKLWPWGDGDLGERAEFNRHMADALDCELDYQALLLRGLHRPPSTALRPTLARRIEQFQSRGRAVLFDGETLTATQWITALLGMGIVPERVDALIAPMPQSFADGHCRAIRDAVVRWVRQIPPQSAYLRQRSLTASPMRDSTP